ncbi:putative reverse transcriptase domain-containing protein [Tanacetum coccineum]
MFRSCGAKDVFGTEGVVGLLTWFESMESVLHIIQIRGWEAAIAQPWEDFKKLLMEEYCPNDEIQKLESEFWNHKMVGSDIDRGLAPKIKANVTSFKPDTIQSAVSMANHLTTDGIKDGIFKKNENVGDKKRSNNQFKNRGRNDRNNIQMTERNFVVTAPDQEQVQCQYVGPHPKCAKCNFHNSGNCPTCGRCNQVGHYTRYCTSRTATERPRPTCYECGDPNHLKRNCPRNQARGRAFAMGAAKAPQDSNVVMGTFSLNDHFATILFASGADFSFISTNLLPLIDMKPNELEGRTFIINLRMDWLSKLRAKIVCYEKIVQIPLSNREILEVHGEHSKGNLKQLKTMKVDEQKVRDILVVCNFPGIFPKGLSGLPPSREVEFRIDLIPRAMPVAKSPYHLAPTEMNELSNQLKEIQD